MPARPSVIWIVADQHRGQSVGHLGDPNVRTPNLDALAAEGVSFRRAYANCPVCTPSRGTMLSGRHAHCGPVQGFFDTWKARAPSLATQLAAGGWRTAWFGKWHLGTSHDQIPAGASAGPGYGGRRLRTPEYQRAGFQEWQAWESCNEHFNGYVWANDDPAPTALPGYSSDAITDRFLAWLGAQDGAAPVFAALSIIQPHFPLDLPERWLRLRPEEVRLPPNVPDLPQIRAQYARYCGMVENVDWNVGRVLDLIARTPWLRDCLVVYTSDHGEFLGAHGRICRKEHPFEEAVRIPAILRMPERIPARGPVEGLFSLVDLAPTTLGLLGRPVPGHMQGHDWSRRLIAGDGAVPECVLLEMHGVARWNMDLLDWRGLVDARWKYAMYETGDERLHDLEADPWEAHDLSRDRPAETARQRARLLGLLRATREPYFDVLIEDGVEPPRARDVGRERGSFNHCWSGAPDDANRWLRD